MEDKDVQNAIETARWMARRHQRQLVIFAALAAVVLFASIALHRWWGFAGVFIALVEAKDARARRNHQLRRLHRMGAIRWMGADPAEFGTALSHPRHFRPQSR